MLLTHLDIKNFRGIEELSLPLNKLCVLIGENNAGKSTILDAVRICLTRTFARRATVFNEYDYHLESLNSEPASAKPIEITLTFAESEENKWSDEISQRLSAAVQIDNEGLRCINFHVTSRYDQLNKNFVTDYEFLNLSGQSLPRAKNPQFRSDLQQLVPTFYLSSLRDAAQEFQTRSPFWEPFVRNLDIDDQAQSELETALEDLNRKILESHTAFDSVKERLDKTAKLMPLGDSHPVSIDAVPTKIFDILSRTQVLLTSKTGAKIPILRHGSGTQSIAVICLFDAFLQSQLKDKFGDDAEPLLALEEPEAHLHPSAIRAVGKMIQELSGQKLISTHSGDLLAEIPLHHIRRIRRRNGKITVHWLDDEILTSEEQNKLDYQVRTTRGNLLFARCWLLVEGETDATLMSECARAMGYEFVAEGVSCIEFSQVGVDKYIKLADQLGIEWFVLADNDEAGNDYIVSATKLLNGRDQDHHVCLLDHGNMELFLCMEGFGHIYERTVADQNKNKIHSQTGTFDYWQQVINAQKSKFKTRNALEVAEQMHKIGSASVPVLLEDVINKVCDLARSAS